VAGNRWFDLILFFVVVFSVTVFLLTKNSEKVVLFNVSVSEGSELPGGGRDGNLIIYAQSKLDTPSSCHFNIEILQGMRLIWTNRTPAIIYPGLQRYNLSVFLPSGQNQVKVDAECD